MLLFFGDLPAASDDGLLVHFERLVGVVAASGQTLQDTEM